MTKILLVEDDKSLREIYGVRLMAEGYEIVSSGDGEEALATAVKEKPDLIISDVMMPKISGFDMLDILRSTPETKDIKVIMMTALSSEDQRARGESLGADKYLVKSQVGIEDVVRTVREVLSGQSTPAATAPKADAAQAAPAPTPPAPTPAASPTPAPGTPTAPVVNAPSAAPTQEQTTAEENLPQPTAPFSSSGPASMANSMPGMPAPTATPEPSVQQPADVAAQIAQELGQVPTSPASEDSSNPTPPQQ